MKTLSTLLLCLLMGYSHMECVSARTGISPDMLLHQTWRTTDQNGYDVYYEFQEPGFLDIIRQKDEASGWTPGHWNLVELNGQDFLQIKYGFTEAWQQYLIELKSGRLELTSGDEFLRFESLQHSARAEKISKKDLIGKWKSPFYNKRSGKLAQSDTKPKLMWMTAFEFLDDGTFIRRTQLGTYVESETGIWSLSEDGKFIKLHFTLNGVAENIYKKELLNIYTYRISSMDIRTNFSHSNPVSKFELRKL